VKFIDNPNHHCHQKKKKKKKKKSVEFASCRVCMCLCECSITIAIIIRPVVPEPVRIRSFLNFGAPSFLGRSSRGKRFSRNQKGRLLLLLLLLPFHRHKLLLGD
jgi:hypothetical protein